MCASGISTRKRFLTLLHNIVLARVRGENTKAMRSQLKRLVNKWLDELEFSHQPEKCDKCGHEIK